MRDATPRFDVAPSSPEALLSRANRLLDDAQAILSRASDGGDDRLALQAVREVRSSLELVMRAHGMLAPDAVVTIDARQQSLRVLSGLSLAEIRALAAGSAIADDSAAVEQRDAIDATSRSLPS